MLAMRRRLIAITTGALVLLLAGCGGDNANPSSTTAAPAPPPSAAPPKIVIGSPTYDRIQKRGKLVAGIAEAPGLAARDGENGGYAGFEVEIGRLIAGKLGLTEQDVLFKPLPAGLRRDAVANGDIDLQIGGITAASAEPGKLSVAGPYLTSTPGLLAKHGGAVTGVDSVRGQPVCVSKASAALAAVEQAGLSLHIGDSLADCVNQLGSGGVLAVADDAAPLLGYASTKPDVYTVLGLPGPQTVHDVGVASRDKAFQAKLDAVLHTSAQDGDWQQRYDRTLGRAGGVFRLAPPTVDGSTAPPTPTPSR